MLKIPRRSVLAALVSPLAAPAIARAQGVVDIEFYFPVAVGGPITALIDRYVAGFMAERPGIRVRATYAGSYVDTLTKAVTAMKAGKGPQLAVLLAVDAFSLIDDDLIVPFDTPANNDPNRVWLDSFYPAFLRNGQIGGHTWGVPFQRSTIVAYWNKDIFRAAGLDPEHAPDTWAELISIGEKTTKRDGDRTTQWGVEIPGTSFTYWLYQALAIQNGLELANLPGTKVFFNERHAVEALQYWIDLGNKYRVHPQGIVEWATAPRDFLEGKTSMIWHTTGNLSNIKANAKFPFGVAMLPAKRRPGSPTGGGNFYLFKNADTAQREASITFLRWITSPARAAQWGIDTGYVATSPAAWETDAMKSYVANFPYAAVARDQLEVAVPELSTHANQHVAEVLSNEVQAALTGRKIAKDALDSAQSRATLLLKPFNT